jgi:imidazolonepropionase-like amidohydrolase
MRGATFPAPSLELQTAVIQAAHAHGLVAVAHALSYQDTLTVLKAGVDGMTHTFYNGAPIQELLDFYKKNNCFVVPTLCAGATFMGTDVETSKKLAAEDLAQRVLDEDTKTCFCGRLMSANETCKPEYVYETVRMIKENGLAILGLVNTLSPHHPI